MGKTRDLFKKIRDTKGTLCKDGHDKEDAREGNGNPLQYSCLENPMDRGAWDAVRGITKSRA